MMLNKKTTIICTAVICIMLCNTCGRKAEQKQAVVTADSTLQAEITAKQNLQFASALKETVSDRSNQFAFDLLYVLAKSKPNSNVFFSPFSISQALTAVYNGAEGETKEEMKRALYLEGIDPDELNGGHAALLDRFTKADSMLTIQIANSVWINSALPFSVSVKADFRNVMTKFYKAEIDLLDFKDANSVKTINDWVDDKTHHQVNSIVKNLEPAALMCLLNAIYFKGRWVREFDPSDTKPGPFFLAGDKVKKTEIMKQKDYFGYFRAKTFHALSLRYFGKMSMQIFLPIERNGIFSFLDSMNAGRWRRWNSLFESKEVNVSLPKFKLEFEQELKNSLKNIGMNIPFDEKNADFHGLAEYADPNKVFISTVRHKAMVDVNEKGTVAAAVTALIIGATGGPSGPPIPVFNADHPFFFVIRDDSTNCILFSGILMDPGGHIADKDDRYSFEEPLPQGGDVGHGNIDEIVEELKAMGGCSLVAGEEGGGLIGVGIASVTGGPVSAGDIQAVIDQGANSVNSCYQKELKKSPDLKGKLSMQIKVNAEGSVSGVMITSNSFGDAVTRCIENKIRKWSFPRFKKGYITVNETFVFRR